jgi:hypothetical protein
VGHSLKARARWLENDGDGAEHVAENVDGWTDSRVWSEVK